MPRGDDRMIWALIVTVVGAYTALWGWIAWRNRRRDAQKGKLRLLVEENDLPVWRIVKGQCLVGFTKWKNFEVTAGYRRAPDWEEWVIIRSFKGSGSLIAPRDTGALASTASARSRSSIRWRSWSRPCRGDFRAGPEGREAAPARKISGGSARRYE
jgi:hypothetical protein